MHTPLFLREQLNTLIAAGDLAAVAAIVDECKRAGARRFAAVFAPDDSDEGASLPLFEAVRVGQGAIVSLLLQQGCGLEQRDKIGATALHQAYGAGQLSIAAQLIAAGADIRATTKLGTRVLDTVLASGNMEQVDWFVGQGVALASVNEKGDTALHFACRSGNIELAMRIHDSCGIAFDCAAQDGRRPLDACSSYALFAAIVQRHPAIALDIGFEDGGCSLHGFARRGCTDIVCHLLDAGCDGDRLVAYKNTLMHSAVASGKADLVEELLRRKLKVEGRNTVNYRPLHWAAEQGDLDIVRLLVEQGGAKVNIKGKLNFIIRESKTPLYMAVDEGHADVARYLVDRGAELNALNDQANRTAACAAAGQGDSALLRYLLERGASPNGVNRDPDSVRGDFSSFPLANAANAAVVDVLVEFGVDLNAHDCSLRPESALRYLVGRIEKKDLESERGRARLGAIKALLRHGAHLSDDAGQIVDDARCVEVSRLLRAAERRELVPAATSAQVAAGDEPSTGLGITLFQQSLHCSKADQLAMFIETLRDADSADVNHVSEDGYHRDETMLHRVLNSFRCYEPDGEDAPIAMLRDCVKLLLDKGANPDAVETLYGETPYHKVARMVSSAF